MPLPPTPAPRAVGVDDWALRKGRTYGTILVDLLRRRPLALLPGRTATVLAEWLRQHPGVRVVARDRSTEYARGVSMGAPQARQVADRWHLLHNVRQVAERWLAGTHARLRRLPPLMGTAASGSQRAGAFPRSRNDVAVGAGSRVRRLALHEEIRRRHPAGELLLAISRRMGLSRGTVRRYALAESFPERALPRPRPSILDPHLDYLDHRLAQGCENALALWRELQARGFPGTRRQVSRWLQPRRRTPSPFGPRPACSPARPVGAPPPASVAAALPSAKSLAWMMAKDPDTLSAGEMGAIARIAQDTEASVVVALLRRFANLVRSSSVTSASPCRAPVRTFRSWARDASASGLRFIATFAAALQNDAAVKAALSTRWSNAQCEGQITRLKLLKRQMYGRASLDLLQRRMLLAP